MRKRREFYINHMSGANNEGYSFTSLHYRCRSACGDKYRSWSISNNFVRSVSGISSEVSWASGKRN